MTFFLLSSFPGTLARLATGSNQYEGRLELYYEHYGWGTVCDDRFDTADAKVACRMLGLSGGWTVFNGFGAGSGWIWLDNVECSGTEDNFDECDHNGWGVHDCVHGEDAGIRCGRYDKGISNYIQNNMWDEILGMDGNG